MLIRTKIPIKVNKSEPSTPCSHETLNLDNSSKNTKFQKNFNFEFYSGLAFYWYHSHFFTMNISIGQNCLNKKNQLSI